MLFVFVIASVVALYTEMKNIKIEITGKVYKTGFRYFVKQMAEKLSVAGTVKYSANRSIVIEASGNDNSLDQFIGNCRLGSLGSEVESVLVTENSLQYQNSFTIQFENNEEYSKI